MKNTNMTNGYLLLDKVNINFNVLGVPMLDRVGGHVDGANIVTIDNSCRLQGKVELTKKLMNPPTFCNGVSYSTILSFSTETGNRCLSFGRPRNQIVTQIHTES
uniref:Uncharacterized protein n=1 Tax=Arundo donax TaxID=35708 RepID=A0A0A8YGQ0_ARUDO